SSDLVGRLIAVLRIFSRCLLQRSPNFEACLEQFHAKTVFLSEDASTQSRRPTLLKKAICLSTIQTSQSLKNRYPIFYWRFRPALVQAISNEPSQVLNWSEYRMSRSMPSRFRNQKFSHCLPRPSICSVA